MIDKGSTLNSYTKRLFGEIFVDQHITEIVVNKIGEIWIERESIWQRIKSESVTAENLIYFANSAAAFSNNTLNGQTPILSSTMPHGERLQIIMPPACDDSQFSITIRKPNDRIFSLNDFKEKGFFDQVVIGEYIDENNRNLNGFLSQKDYQSFFELAVSCGTKNIVIAGATGSGKTTFMKSLVVHIPHDERLITIEDVREIKSDVHQNMVNLLYPSEKQDIVSPTKLLKSCLRMKPDRILLAELRGGETFDYINVISSGHGGSLTSIHAGSYDEAVRRLVSMAMQNETGQNVPYETLKEIILQAIDVIAIIENHKGKRCIKSLHFKDYKEG
ncbi:P-type DNA transfer ATPase VirB11 [Orbus sturtevantii]|uniref:P-type DNA transfer ATPase VirB11 n=1 Tax=Orbus sturtevantii TaxID=3074109 RepID=UPI00370D19A8